MAIETASKQRAARVLGLLTVFGLAVTTFLMFFVAREADASMGGQLQRIFYVHVPSAWVGYLAFAVVFVSSIAYLRTGSRRWDLLAHSSAEIGVLFVTLVLVTGPIWAHPVWGTWWEWDARLTSALVMWLTYVGYLFLRNLTVDPRKAGRMAAVVGIVGFVNVPIVHFSVQWWRTLHPSGPTLANPIDSSGLGGQEVITFLTSLAAFTLLYAWLLVQRSRVGHLADRVEELEVTEQRERVPVTA
jgi:heme exporter protein C